MLHLVALSCHLCRGTDGAQKPRARFFGDTTSRRPIFGTCSHAACSKCVQLNPEMRCRVCQVENAFKNQPVNFAAVEIIKDYQKDCIDVYRKWWNGKTSDSCPGCKEKPTSPLRICTKCNDYMFYEKKEELRVYLKNPEGGEELAKFFRCTNCIGHRLDQCDHDGRKMKMIDKLQNFDESILEPVKDRWGKNVYTCPNCQEKDNYVRFCLDCANSLIRKEDDELYVHLSDPADIYRLPKSLRCSDCITDENTKCSHARQYFHSVEKLKNFETEVKKFTALIVRNLLLEQLEKWAELGTCKLQYMRISRMCEVLNSLSNFIHPDWFPEHFNVVFEGFEDDFSLPTSKVSKFFSPMEWDVDRSIDKTRFEDLPEKLFSVLEFQLAEYQKISNIPCQCSDLWKKYQDKGVLEQQFVRIIEEIPLTEKFEKCPGNQRLQNLEELEEGVQMKFPFKTQFLPSVFCWNKYRGGFCDVFDSVSLKPCICRKCKNSICLKCIKSNFNIKCPFCEAEYNPDKSHDSYYFDAEDCLVHVKKDKKQLRKMHREYEHDKKIMELTEFYKENAVKVYEGWWRSENTGGYCMKCQSYSSQLEICVLCEMAHPEGAIRANGQQLEFYAPSETSRISTRFQCSNCATRLRSLLEQENSIIPKEVRHLESPVEMFRGCNHKSRVKNGCWKYDKVWVKDEKFTQSVMRVSDIQNCPLMLKWADWNVVHRILRARIDEQFENKEELMNVVENLESRTRKYLVEALNGSVVDYTLKGEIDNLISDLKL